MSDLRPRRCVLDKGPNGYGFHLHGDKGNPGQFIRQVEADSPAAHAGLLAGDQLSFVNGVCVTGESHQQVVTRIRATVGRLHLVVVDAETAELLNNNHLECREEYVTEGIPLTHRDATHRDSTHRDSAESNGSCRQSTSTPGENENRLSVKDSNLRPRLCSVKKGVTGYGFNLHSEKSKPGQYIRAVDQDSPAEKAGLKPMDKIIQVNSISVVMMQHAEVVTAIKVGGDETVLLVVDPKADAFFNSCNVTPTESHITGPLPEPVASGGAQEQINKAEAELKPKVSVSASTSSSSSTESLLPAAPSSRPPELQMAPVLVPEAGLSLSLSLAQAKEQARQKRIAKKAPAMDWSKRNELFSNL
ncbi:hypothetical protein DPEC_G00029980 [Dallia pectoralis]|uniref:Uncharacterized protein n=1 Tax=Dallia pectoralis TaxID=75939 RepID=A0ACC2HC08_DALPE|nr:hypothetical protein DPEC_G00029980 [Dallia pectoralis]